MYISGAKFKEQCSNIARDILDCNEGCIVLVEPLKFASIIMSIEHYFQINLNPGCPNLP